MKKKLCITYHVSGKYDIFFSEFIRTFDLLFCNDCDKTFFIFCDNQDILEKSIQNITITSKVKFFDLNPVSENIDNVKFRKFKILNQAEVLYPNYDYIVFCNSNLICKQRISFNEMFSDKEMFCCTHPFFDKIKNPMYDQLCGYPNSAAYFDAKSFNNYHYVQAGFFGCNSKRWKKLVDLIESCRYYDSFYGYEKYIPWHDETYYNKAVNLMTEYESDKIHILDGKMYLCTDQRELRPYYDSARCILINKNKVWKERGL